MGNQTSEGFAYIERQYKDVKGRIELQRRVVEQLHIIEADASQAEASLNALLDDEASKLRTGVDGPESLGRVHRQETIDNYADSSSSACLRFRTKARTLKANEITLIPRLESDMSKVLVVSALAASDFLRAKMPSIAGLISVFVSPRQLSSLEAQMSGEKLR
jgi:hypothetical protein